MPFLLLLLLTLVCIWEKWPQPLAWVGLPGSPVLFTLLTWMSVIFIVALAGRIAHRTSWQLYLHPERRDSILNWYGNRRVLHLLALLANAGLSLIVLGWGWTVQNLFEQLHGAEVPGLDQSPPGTELLILAPFLASLVLSWACFYDADRALHDTSPHREPRPFWTRRAYLLFHARHNLVLAITPVALIILQKGLRRLLPHWPDRYFELANLALLAAAFICFPWILRLVLGLKPLPEGPLRQRLLAASRRLRFRCSNILLWNTNAGIVNAMVAGIVPGVRYVLLTDRLVSELTPDEVEAVFGHEVGHVKHGHMLYYMGFLFISWMAVAALWPLAASAFPELNAVDLEEDWVKLPFVALVGAYIFVVFGFLSRRCERQADVYGCRAVSCARQPCPGHEEATVLQPGGSGLCETGIRIFIDALEKVARLNGISRSRPGLLQSWQHSTIARRVEFLQRVLADPGVEPRFQRTVALVKWVVFLGLLGLVVVGSLWGGGWSYLWPPQF